MSGKKSTGDRDAEGFLVLRKIDKGQSSSPQEGLLPSVRTPSVGRNAKGGEGKRRERAEGKKKERKQKCELLHWYYDDERTIASVIKCKSKFSEPALLKNEADIKKSENRLKKMDINIGAPSKLPIGVKTFSGAYSDAYNKFRSNPPPVASAFEAFRVMTGDGLRACLKSSNKDGDESKSKHLSRNKEFSFTIFPKSAEFVEPAK